MSMSFLYLPFNGGFPRSFVGGKCYQFSSFFQAAYIYDSSSFHLMSALLSLQTTLIRMDILFYYNGHPQLQNNPTKSI